MGIYLYATYLGAQSVHVQGGRWYPSVLGLANGSVLVMGGETGANAPTLEHSWWPHYALPQLAPANRSEQSLSIHSCPS